MFDEQNNCESLEKDEQIKALMNKHNIPYTLVYKDTSVDTIVDDVMKALKLDSYK